jgi:hypothetical protein
MKIVCTKDEFVGLVRWCEAAKSMGMCDECPLFSCNGPDTERDELADMCQIVREPEKV